LSRQEQNLLVRSIATSLSIVPLSARYGIALAFALAAAMSLFANTPGLLRRASPPACYCRCSQSHARAGCVKMCETRKRATRWGASTCAKPRIKPPAENPGAGPRFPRSDRAERASL